MILSVNSDYFLEQNKLVFVMVKCCVFFAVRAEFLNIIYMSFGFKGLIFKYQDGWMAGAVMNVKTWTYNLKRK
jgi:hypothetical protein